MFGMAQSTTSTVRLSRRFFAYLARVVRHTKVLFASFITGSLVSAPEWLKPLLPSKYAAVLEAWSSVIFEPETYWRLALTCLLVGIFIATFLAWNEERNESEKLTSQIHESKPFLTAHSPGWSYAHDRFTAVGYQTDPMLMLRFHIEIINGGADTSLRGWQGAYRLSDNRRVGLSDAMFDRSVSSVVDQVNLVSDDRTLSRGGRRLGWVQFPIQEDEASRLQQVAVQFFDHTGQMHSVECPPEWMLRASETKS